MLMAVTLDKDGKRCFVFSGGERLTLSQGMNAALLEANAASIDPNPLRKIFLHDRDAHGVDVQNRYDGKPPSEKWWEQMAGDVTPVEVLDGC